MISQDSRFDCLHRSHWITYGAGEWVTGSGQRRPRDNWKAQHPDFLGSLKAGKEEADARVERSLYSRAVGYSFNSEKIFCNKDGEVTRVPYRRARAARRHGADLLAEEPRPGAVARRLAARARARQVRHLRQADDRGGVDKERAVMIDVTPEKDELLPI